MAMSESDLMGVDPVTGQGHWYAVSGQGETHDHLTHWVSPTEMQAHYSWVENGQKMDEQITVKFPNEKAMQFRGVVRSGGKDVSAFCRRPMQP